MNHNTSTDTHTPPRYMFPKPSTEGWVWGKTTAQATWLLAAALTVLTGTFSGNILGALVIATVVGVVGWGHYEGRPFVTYLWIKIQALYRRLTGNTRYIVTPESPIKQGTLYLPGALGARLDVWATGYLDGAAMLIDKYARTATVIIMCDSSSVELSDTDTLTDKTLAYANLGKVSASIEGVVRVAPLVRVVPHSSDAASKYYEEKIVERQAGPLISEVADQHYRAALLASGTNEESQPAVTRELYVAITVDLNQIRASIRNAGGAKDGIAKIMARTVSSFNPLLKDAGSFNSRWLNYDQVLAVLKTGLDPSTATNISTLTANGLTPVTPKTLAPSSINEQPTYVQVDNTFHRTFWISQWPRDRVQLGFFAPLLVSGAWGRNFTMVWATGLDGYKQIRQDRAAAQSLADRQLRREEQVRADVLAELDDIDEREEEIVNGHLAVRYTGYLSINAQSLEELEDITSQIGATTGGQLDLRLLRDQQLAALQAAALPAGWGLTTRKR